MTNEGTEDPHAVVFESVGKLPGLHLAINEAPKMIHAEQTRTLNAVHVPRKGGPVAAVTGVVVAALSGRGGRCGGVKVVRS